MQLPADYHMHTPLCKHATGEPVEYAAQAVAAGLKEIGFSDHSPMRVDGHDDWRMNLGDLNAYSDKVGQARAQFPEITIKFALEVDFLPDQQDWIRELAAMRKWDYFIGSVHYIKRWAIDNPNTMEDWRARDTFEIWSEYFERLTLAAESGLFDIIGHADLCKKFCFYPTQDCTPLYQRFLKAAAGSGVAIELNTAGLRKDCKEIYPSLAFLRLARAAEVPITFGSDAHAPGEVGASFSDAINQARAAGYTHWTRFTARRKEAVPL